MNRFISFFAKLAALLAKLSGILLFAISFLVCIHVILRGFFNSGINGIYEIVSYGMLTIVSITLAENELTGGSIVVNVVLDLLKPRVASVLGIIMYIITSVVLGFVLYYQMGMVTQKYANGAETGVLAIPHWILVVIICVGIFFLILATVIRIIKMIRDHKLIENKVLTIDERASELTITSEF